MEYKDIASVSGKGGLFKIVNPTRSGVILESLDQEKKKMVIGAQAKVSVLSDIAIYTTDQSGSVPLAEVFQKIHTAFNGDTGLKGSNDPEELRAFMKYILPDYDEERVYVSDIKKVISWYHQLVIEVPELLAGSADKTTEK
jgi:hypothetical protein